MTWRCPGCLGSLFHKNGRLRCESCSAQYGSIGGIPDLRVPARSWIDYEADSAKARVLLGEMEDLSLEELVRRIFSEQGGGEERVALRTRQVLTGPDRMRRELREWLDAATRGDGVFLDLGCGSGMVLAAAAKEGRKGIGIDVSMVWLIVAQRLIRAWGAEPVLAAAHSDALPLADGSVTGVVSLDLIEHVGDPGHYLSELNRVVRRDGRVALSTPNRYSLTAEPHVLTWGVGWLPRSVQRGYVRWRTGTSYEFVRLLSKRELTRLFHAHTDFKFRILAPRIPDEEISRFPRYRAALAALYNWLHTWKWIRAVFLYVGPFFRVIAEKPEDRS